MCIRDSSLFFFQAEDGIRGLVRSRGLGYVYKRQVLGIPGGAIDTGTGHPFGVAVTNFAEGGVNDRSQLPMFEVYGLNNTNSNAVSYTHLTLPTSALV